MENTARNYLAERLKEMAKVCDDVRGALGAAAKGTEDEEERRSYVAAHVAFDRVAAALESAARHVAAVEASEA